MTGFAFTCSCGKGFASDQAMQQHRRAIGCKNAKQRKNKKSSSRLKQRHRAAARRNDPTYGYHGQGLDRETAIELADAMDLPDGAYFAMIGDLMDGDYSDGIEAVIADMD